MLKKILAGVCLLGLCAGFLTYNLGVPETSAPETTQPPLSNIPGQVRFVNPDPSLQAAWEQIAEDYTAETGNMVQILPEADAEGVTPTLFTVADEKELEEYADVCLDLAGVKASHHLDWSLSLYAGKKMCGLPVEVEGYGLIYNAELLRNAGVTATDINSFSKLAEVTKHISTTVSLKFSPFACMDKNTSALALLACMPGDIRPFWDLYIANTACERLTADDDGPTQEILNDAAVFCIGSTKEFGEVCADSQTALNIMPLYIGMENEARQGLCIRVERYWCVRNDVPKADIEATLAFLDYLVHPKEGPAPVDRLQIFTPYTTAAYYSSPLEKTMRDHITAGKKLVVFSQLSAPAGLAQAMEDYAADPTDENWKKVTDILE